MAVRIAALLLLADTCGADEIEPYKLTGVDGYVTLQYVNDKQRTDASAAAGSRQTQSALRNEIFVMTNSYVYHPNFMTLAVGGGPVFYGESFAGDTGEAKARGAQYNLTIRATLLRDKPYTGSIFFSHLNPAISIAPGQVMTQESTRFGIDFSLLAAVSPLPLQAGFTRTRSQGRGPDRLVDDRADQFNLNASHSFGAFGTTQVQYQAGRQASHSGSQNLPIQSSTASNHSLNVDTRLQFGDDRQYDLVNLLSFNTQAYALGSGELPKLQDTRFVLDLHARHSGKLHSHATYTFGHSSQGGLNSVTQAASAGFNYRPMAFLEASFGMRGDGNRTRQFVAQSHGVDGSVRFEQQLPIGVGQASYGVRYEHRSQQAQSSRISILGERIILTGLAYAAISRPHVLVGSLVVSNAGRTQVFVDGVDYLLAVVGTETRLQRLIGGRIISGEQLLVDYSYDIGGTYAYSQFDQTLNLSWNLARFLNGYFRYSTSTPRLATGAPTFPLNEVRNAVLGFRADLPVNPGLPITIGGSIEVENRVETISPYRRVAGDLFLQTDEPIFGLGYFRASMRRSRIDYRGSAQDSNVRGYELRYWSRQWFGIDLTALLSAERDDGWLVPRSRYDGSIGMQWQERRFTLSSSLVRTRECQAGVERDRTTFQFLAKRDF